MEDLGQRVYRFMQREGLVQDQTGEQERKVLVGVSGGPDSVCLLHILDQLKDALGVRLHVAHLNHMLRGVESDADASYVKELSDTLGIPATVGMAGPLSGAELGATTSMVRRRSVPVKCCMLQGWQIRPTPCP